MKRLSAQPGGYGITRPYHLHRPPITKKDLQDLTERLRDAKRRMQRPTNEDALRQQVEILQKSTLAGQNPRTHATHHSPLPDP